MTAKLLHTGDPLRRDEIQRHKAAFLEVVPKASRRAMLALSPEMTTMIASMRTRWTKTSILPKLHFITVSSRFALQFIHLSTDT